MLQVHRLPDTNKAIAMHYNTVCIVVPCTVYKVGNVQV